MVNYGTINNENKQYLLYIAIQNNDEERALEMLSDGDYPNDYVAKSNKYHWTMLHWAAFHGNEEIIKSILNNHSLLVENGNKKEYQKFLHSSPLHRCAQRGHLGVCWQLLLSSFSIDETDHLGNTALHVAAASGFDYLVVFFIVNGANMYCTNNYKLSPLQVASTDICRNILRDFMQKFPSQNSKEKRAAMHETQKLKYSQLKSEVDAIYSNDHVDNENIDSLRRKVDRACEFGIPRKNISLARWRIKWLETDVELKEKINKVKNSHPTITATLYNEVNILQLMLNNVRKRNSESIQIPKVTEQLMMEGSTQCEISKSEFALGQCMKHIQDIFKCKKHATKDDTSIISQLKESTAICDKLEGDRSLIESANNMSKKIISEIELQTSFENIPNVKLPIPGMTAKKAKEYWGPDDYGCIVETDEYPLAPKSGYIWKKSLALQNLQLKIGETKVKMIRAVEYKADNELILVYKEELAHKEEEERQLLEKDAIDHEEAVKHAEKKAKKYMKKKKKKKK